MPLNPHGYSPPTAIAFPTTEEDLPPETDTNTPCQPDEQFGTEAKTEPFKNQVLPHQRHLSAERVYHSVFERPHVDSVKIHAARQITPIPCVEM